MTVAEGAGSTFEDAHNLVDPERHELNMTYPFEGIDLANDPKGYSVVKFKKVYSKWDSAFENKGWLSIFLANHDNARMVSRFGNDSFAFRELSSKMLTTFLMTMRGTPYYYNGDELGMINIKFNSIADYRDVQTINGYKNVKANGGDTMQYLALQKFSSRDNRRTPFQWDASANAEFTTGKPWLKVNPDYTNVNESAQNKNASSVLNYFRKAIQLRKANAVLVYEKYQLLDAENTAVYAYTREGNGQKILVVLNFTGQPATVKTGINLSRAKILLGNYPIPPKTSKIRPFEAIVYQLEP